MILYASHEPGVVTKSSPIVDEYQLIDERDLKWSRGESDSLFVEFEHFREQNGRVPSQKKKGFESTRETRFTTAVLSAVESADVT